VEKFSDLPHHSHFPVLNQAAKVVFSGLLAAGKARILRGSGLDQEISGTKCASENGRFRLGWLSRPAVVLRFCYDPTS